MLVALLAWYAGVFVLFAVIAARRGITVWAYLGHLLQTWVRGWVVWLRVLGVAAPRQRVSYARIAALERELGITANERSGKTD